MNKNITLYLEPTYFVLVKLSGPITTRIEYAYTRLFLSYMQQTVNERRK